MKINKASYKIYIFELHLTCSFRKYKAYNWSSWHSPLKRISKIISFNITGLNNKLYKVYLCKFVDIVVSVLTIIGVMLIHVLSYVGINF